MKHGCFLRDRFWRLAQGGKKRALVAVAHALVIVIYHVLSTGQPYRERSSATDRRGPKAPPDPTSYPLSRTPRHRRAQ